MPGADFRNHSHADLVAHAEDGLHGLGALVEALERHRDTLVRQQESSNALNLRMARLASVGVGLTIVGVVLAAVQVWAALK